MTYSRDLGHLLRLGGNRAEEPTEEKGDSEGEPQPYQSRLRAFELISAALSDWTHLLLLPASKPNARGHQPGRARRASVWCIAELGRIDANCILEA